MKVFFCGMCVCVRVFDPKRLITLAVYIWCDLNECGTKFKKKIIIKAIKNLVFTNYVDEMMSNLHWIAINHNSLTLNFIIDDKFQKLIIIMMSLWSDEAFSNLLAIKANGNESSMW